MREVFSTAQQPFDQYVMLVLPGAALLLTLYMLFRRKQRRWLWIGGGVTLLLFLLTFALPLADHHHMRAMAAGGDVRTVEGPISAHSRETRRVWTGTSRGVGVTTSDRYRTRTDEGLYIGTQWFAFEVNGYPSQASFTNSGDPPLPLADGTWARASYIADPWYQDELRIVRLSLGEAGGPSTTSAHDQGFAAFWRDFSARVARGDEAGIRARTRFPFLFSGTPLAIERFGQVWQALFAPAPLRQCLGRATPVPDQGAMSVSCSIYVYIFEKGAEGWRFSGFTADPDAF